MEEVNMKYYNRITKEMVNEIVDKVFSKDNGMDIGPCGDGLYYIGMGCYTNKLGYDDYINRLEITLKDYITSK